MTPTWVWTIFAPPRGAQVAPFGRLCGSWPPLGAPSGPSRGSVFRSQSHFGRQSRQSVILSTPPMVFNDFCHPKGCPKGPFWLVLGLLGCTWAPTRPPVDRCQAILSDFLAPLSVPFCIFWCSEISAHCLNRFCVDFEPKNGPNLSQKSTPNRI